MKLNLGSGDKRFDDFINVDLYDTTADFKADICELPFADGTASEIKLIQVLEHIPYNKTDDVLKEMYRVLKVGGFVDLETPNLEVVCQKILEEGLTDNWVHNLVGEYYRPWDKDRYEDWEYNQASIHRNPWTFERLQVYAGDIGFRVEKMDWRDSIYSVEENLFVKLWKDK